jgi:hypothetical protein
MHRTFGKVQALTIDADHTALQSFQVASVSPYTYIRLFMQHAITRLISCSFLILICKYSHAYIQPISFIATASEKR